MCCVLTVHAVLQPGVVRLRYVHLHPGAAGDELVVMACHLLAMCLHQS